MALLKYPDVHFERAIEQPEVPVFFISGKDEYLILTCVQLIKQLWVKQYPDSDFNKHYVEQSNDWNNLFQDALCFDLFSEYGFTDVSFNKKKIDTTSKKAIQEYTQNPNPKRALCIRAPELNLKQEAKWLSTHKINGIQIQALSVSSQKQWIIQKLKDRGLNCNPTQVGTLIHQHTQSELFAAEQVIERLTLCYADDNTLLTESMVIEQCIQHTDFQIFEFTTACLVGDFKKAYGCLQKAAYKQTEPLVILWHLTDLLRKLEQAHTGISFQSMGVFSFKEKYYKMAQKRLNHHDICELFKQAHHIDLNIKTGLSESPWVLIEHLTQLFCVKRVSN